MKEWLLAAEYLLAGGNENVVLCERGIKTFETEMRNTIGPGGRGAGAGTFASAGDRRSVARHRKAQPDSERASRAALAIGADGLIIEVHPCPERALSDGPQSLDFASFEKVMKGLSDPLRGVARLEAARA